MKLLRVLIQFCPASGLRDLLPSKIRSVRIYLPRVNFPKKCKILWYFRFVKNKLLFQYTEYFFKATRKFFKWYQHNFLIAWNLRPIFANLKSGLTISSRIWADILAYNKWSTFQITQTLTHLYIWPTEKVDVGNYLGTATSKTNYSF